MGFEVNSIVGVVFLFLGWVLRGTFSAGAGVFGVFRVVFEVRSAVTCSEGSRMSIGGILVNNSYFVLLVLWWCRRSRRILWSERWFVCLLLVSG